MMGRGKEGEEGGGDCFSGVGWVRLGWMDAGWEGVLRALGWWSGCM